MATSVLGKLGEKAKKFSADVNSLLPEDIEKTALDEKQKNVDDYQSNYAGEKHSGGGLPAIGESAASSQDKINRHYGDRPGEKLIDTKPMLKPLGEGQPSTPLYDEGGDVDAGGKDKHQLAVLQDGEKVLTPDEAAQYKADQALKAHPVEEAENKPPANPSKEMQDAQKKADNPGAPSALPVPPPEQLPTASHEERVAIKKDQQDAMGKGVNGLVGLGMANIHAKQLGLPGVPFKIEDMKAPEGLNQGAKTPDVEGPGLQVPKELQHTPQSAPAGLPTIGGTDTPAPATPAAPASDGFNGLDYKAKLEKLKQDHAAALHLHTPEGKVKADYIQDEINDLHKNNPWGSKENHPGILGKLGHVAAKAGNIAGDVLAPGLMGLIPGTDLNKMYERGVQSNQEAKDTAQVAELEKADALKAKNQNPQKVWRPLPKPVLNPATGKYEEALFNQANPDEISFKGESQPTAVKPSSAADKHAFQETLAKTGDPNAADPVKQIAALHKAKEEGKISDEELAQAYGFLGSNVSAPATSVSAAGTKAQQNAEVKDAHKFYTWTEEGANGPVVKFGKGNQAPADAEVAEQDPKTFLNEARASNVVQQSLNQIYEDVEKHPEVFDNPAARAIMATTLEQIDRTSAGLLVAGTGGSIPLPSGLGDMINTHLQNHSLDPKSAEAVKNYIADYKSMKDKVIAMQMEMQGGKIGRGSHEAFKAIADQIPNGGTPDSKTAIRQMTNLQRTQSQLSEKYPDQYQGYKKEKPYQPKAHAEGGNNAPAGATDEVSKDGHVVGHIVVENGKKRYVPLQSKQ